jgi:hypothetical protein
MHGYTPSAGRIGTGRGMPMRLRRWPQWASRRARKIAAEIKKTKPYVILRQPAGNINVRTEADAVPDFLVPELGEALDGRRGLNWLKLVNLSAFPTSYNTNRLGVEMLDARRHAMNPLIACRQDIAHKPRRAPVFQRTRQLGHLACNDRQDVRL